MNSLDRERGGQRSKPWVLVTVIALLVVGWILAVLLMGGGEDTPPAADGAGEGAESTEPAGTFGEEGESTTEDGLAQGPTEEEDEGDAAEPPEPLEGGVTEEPSGHDPLGTGAGPDDLSDTERDRAELVAANFVLYAYGYTGDNPGEYTENLNEVIVSPEFYSSPGAEHIGEVQQQIENGGTEGAAVLDEFDIAQESTQEIRGVAYFRVGEGYADGGELSGEVTTYGQPLNLVEWGESYRVQAADIREETQR